MYLEQKMTPSILRAFISLRMDSRLHLSSPIAISLLFLFLVFVWIPASLCNDDLSSSCSHMFDCGKINNVGFPFWGENRPPGCGYPGLKLNCESSVTTIDIMNVTYRVLAVNPDTKTLKISREDYLTGICSPDFANTTLDTTLFDFGFGYWNLTLAYGCAAAAASSISLLGQLITCPTGTVQIKLGAYGPGECEVSVFVPVPTIDLLEIWTLPTLEQVIRDGFEVTWKVDTAACSRDCRGSKGVCGYDLQMNRPTCYFSPGTAVISLGVILPIAALSAGLLGTIGIVCYRKRGCFSSFSGVWWTRDARNEYSSAEEIIKKYGSIAPKRYSYSDLKKLTNSFKDKIGKGGFGVVYKGKLHDGRIVAVKVLSSSKGKGDEFVNEVASISGTSHVNVVSLLGFCYERTKRALIYEFMPNGSLDKFIDGGNSSIASRPLDNKMMLQIAVGIARGLEYLHRGCRTRILHFDIKPHNILLDEALCPKISDFGLSKLCKTEQSIVSMMGMRGTPGYIAPEVFSRNFGGVSHKSDVYSYGMLVLEMVGGKKKEFTEGTSNSSEVYFPDSVYSKLEQGENVGTFGESRGEEEEIIKKMTIVGLWCIQTHPSDRPSMSKVIEMLEGTSHSIHIPPRPCLDPPNRSPQDSSTSSLWERVEPSEGE